MPATFLDVVWTLLGLVVGGFALAWIATIATWRTSERTERNSNDLWLDVATALGNARSTPDDELLTGRLTAALDAWDDQAVPQLLVTSLAAEPVDRSVLAAIQDSRLMARIDRELGGRSLDRQIAALQLIGAVGDHRHQPRVLMLAVSDDTRLARAAKQALARIEPVAGLDLLFDSARVDGIWAIEQIKAMLQGGALDAWLSEYGHARLADVVALLTHQTRSADQSRRLTIIDVLAEIPHAIAYNALGQCARSTDPSTATAAITALNQHPNGHRILEQLDLAPNPAPNPAAGHREARTAPGRSAPAPAVSVSQTP